jgi:hypothetical protein
MPFISLNKIEFDDETIPLNSIKFDDEVVSLSAIKFDDAVETPKKPSAFGNFLSSVGSGMATESKNQLNLQPSKIKEIAKTVPFATIRGLEAITSPVTAPLESLGIGTRKMMQDAAEYYRPDIGSVPNYTIDIDKHFKPSIKKLENAPVSEIVGGTAGGVGFILGPGALGMKAGELVTALPSIEKAARPFYRSILKGMIGGALTGEGKVDETLQNAAMFGAFEGLPYATKITKTIKDSTTWRRMTIKERGLVVQSLDDAIKANPKMTEGEILRKWNNPTWMEQATLKRATGEIPSGKIVPLNEIKFDSQTLAPETPLETSSSVPLADAQKAPGQVPVSTGKTASLTESTVGKPASPDAPTIDFSEKTGEDKGEITEKPDIDVLDLMATDILNTKGNERGDLGEGTAHNIGSSNPDWFKKLNALVEFENNNGKKVVKYNGISRDTFFAIQKKIKEKGYESLTEIQKRYYFFIEQVIPEFKAQSPDIKAIDDLAFTEKEGYEPMGGEEIVVGDLNKGDKVLIRGEEFEHKGENKDGDVILEDGAPITADQFDKIRIDGIKKAKGETEILPDGSTVNWNKVETKEKDGLKETYYAVYNKDGSFKKWHTKTEIDRLKSLGGMAGLNLKQDSYGKQTGATGKETKGKQEGLGLVVEDPNQPGMFAFQPAENFERRKAGEETVSTEPVKRSDIVKFLQEKFDVPLRVGRFRVPSALGIFKVKPEVIRTRMANDIEVIAHEIGHGLHKYIWGMKGHYLNVEPLNPFADELNPIATQARGKQPPIQEGFAEFIRLYVTNEVKARNKAPKFYEFFEQELSDKLPEAQEILLEARDQFNKWATQPYAQRISAQLSIGKNEKTPYSLKDAYTQWIDDLHPLKKAVEEMSKGLDNPLETSKDPYKLARLMAGWTGKADAFLEHKTFDFKTYADKGKSFKEIIDPIKDDIDSFRVYIIAERALELKKRGIETGIQKEDAKKAVAELKDKFSKPFEELKQYQDDCLAYLRDSGVLSIKDYIKIKALNKEYVPFYRVMETQKKGGSGKGLETNKPVHGIKGSWRDIVDPLESIVKNTYTYIQAAEKNAVLKSLVELSNKQEGMGKFIEKIPTPMQKIRIKEPELLGILQKYGKWTETTKYRETQRTVGEKIKNVSAEGEEVSGGSTRSAELMEKQAMDALKARGRTENEAKTILDKIKKAPSVEVKTKIIEREIEKIAVKETVREFGLDFSDDVVDIFRPSAFTPKDNVISVWERGKRSFYQVDPDIARSIQALDKEGSNTLIKILGYPAKWLRAGATLTPEFILRNPLRDQFSAFVYSKYGYLPGVDLTRGIFHLVKADDVYWNWKKSGAEHSMLVSIDREYLQKNLGQVLEGKNIGSITKSIVKNPLQALQVLSELTEEGTRLGEFRNALENKKTKASIQEGGFASREVTLDFHRIGSAGKAVNKLVAFWNANIQGTDKMFRAFKEKPIGTTAKVVAAITLPSILLYMVNRDDPRWKEIPQWQKDLFWIVFTKNNIWRIPKPFELGIIFGSVPERILEYADNQNPRLFNSIISSIMSGASPSFIPSAATPLLENWANKSFFLDRPIVSRDREDVLPAYQYQPYTTELAKSLGKKIDALGVPSLSSPAKIENLIRGWTGGIGTYALQIADLGLRKTGVLPDRIPPTKSIADYPILKAFAVRYPSSGSESIKEFYENHGASAQLKNTAMSLAKKEYKGKEAEALLKDSSYVKMDLAYKAISNGQRFVQLVYANPKINPDEKKRLIDKTYMQMISVAQQANAEFHSKRKGR